MADDALWELGLKSIQELETSEGILASSRGEAYGCIFGRDSLLVALALLSIYKKTKDDYFLGLVEKILRTLGNLQGRSVVLESGEEPGKIIHEFRPDNHEHLTALSESPWFIYPTGEMRNYDSVDSTPLFLIAAHEYSLVGDEHFVNSLRPAVRAALKWLLGHEGFVTYAFHPERKFGGLSVQSWMDSQESLFYEDQGGRPPYPIAPLEVQAYAWSALRRWGHAAKAAALKQRFNDAFVLRGPRSASLAYAIDGAGHRLTAARSSMGHVLWASFEGESILDREHIVHVRNRLLARDLFVPQAGIRTLSSRSSHFDPVSYHNGSIWPHDTAVAADGLESFGFVEDALRVRLALRNAYEHFKTPIELYGYERGFREYVPINGVGGACRVQAWSAAALLSVASSPHQTTQGSIEGQTINT